MNIKFTMEMEKNGSLPFLDVLITKKPGGSLGHTVYRIPSPFTKTCSSDIPYKPGKNYI
jgi:hypothetical protein